MNQDQNHREQLGQQQDFPSAVANRNSSGHSRRNWLSALVIAAAAVATVDVCDANGLRTARDDRTQWVATSGSHNWRIVLKDDNGGRRIWLATDDAPGGREELEETGRNGAAILFKSLKYSGNASVLTATEYRVYYQGKLVFQRYGRWVK
jgi:hypothetical protein